MDGAILARYQDDTHSYKLEMDTDTSGLHLDRWNGGENTLTTVSFSYQVDEWYYQKMKVQGNTISAKVWKAADAEPSNWMITYTDSTFATGRVGLRVNSADVTFDERCNL